MSYHRSDDPCLEFLLYPRTFPGLPSSTTEIRGICFGFESALRFSLSGGEATGFFQMVLWGRS